MPRRTTYRWDRELVAAVTELVARFGLKRVAGMMGLSTDGVFCQLHRKGISLVDLKRTWTGKLGR